MSKIKLTGSNSGYVEIDSAADAGNLTLSLPTSGTRLLSNTDNVFSGITTTGELDINGKIDVSTDILGGRNLKVTGITTHTGTTILNDDVTLTGASYDVLWDKSDNQLEFGDNAKLSFGASSDLQLYHDGTYNRIAANGQIFLQNKAANETYFVGYEHGRVELYWDNSIKLTTETSGVNITGVCTATSFSGSGENLTRTTQLSHRNLIINGAMQVAQRGTTYTGANNYNTIDRFKVIHSGLNEDVTSSQIEISSGTTPYSLGFRKAFRMTNGNQSAGAGTADYLSFQYRIEAQDLASCGWDYKSTSNYITLSFWIKSSVSQNFGCFIRTHDGSQMTFPFETGALSANTWTKITRTIPGNGAIGFSNDAGTGMEINISQFWGTNYTTSSKPLDTWGAYANDSRLKDFPASTWYTTNDATFELTGVQLEVGEQATPFEHRSFTEDLIRCQRYFVKTNFSSHVTAYFGGTHLFRQLPFHCPTPMRAQPSFSLSGQESGTVKFTLKTWSSDQNMTATPNAIHMYHTDYVHGTNNSAVHSLGLGIDFASSNSGVPPNGPGNHNVYSCRVYGAQFDAEL